MVFMLVIIGFHWPIKTMPRGIDTVPKSARPSVPPSYCLPPHPTLHPQVLKEDSVFLLKPVCIILSKSLGNTSLVFERERMREEKRPKNNYRNKNTRRKSSCEWRWNLKITCVIHFVDNIFGSWNFCLFSPCYCLFQKRKMFLDQVEKQKKELGKCRVCFVSL